METTQQFKTTNHPVPSPDSLHIASLNGARLQIRCTTSLNVVRSITLPTDFNPRGALIRWVPIAPRNGRNTSTISRRVLLADDDGARVWDLSDEKWSALISNGSGGMGKIVHAEFGRDGEEVLLWNDFGAKVTVWCLKTGRSVEIKDPKFVGWRGCGTRPTPGGEEGGVGVLALLSRPAGQDVVTLHAPKTYFVIKTVAVPSVDAQGIKWSPDGRWFVIWDAASAGYKVFVYTADGHLYRMYGGETAEGDICGLGIRSVEWTPDGKYLAIAGWDKRVTLLSTKTFSPVVFLDHTPTIQISTGTVWTEMVSALSSRSYSVTAQPVSPPKVASPPNDPAPKLGISLTTSNADGTLIATRDDSTPTTVWIWDLSQLAPKTVIIQHAPVRQLLWHPTIPDLLLIQCIQDDPIVYIWSASSDGPEIITIGLQKPAGTAPARLEARWLITPTNKKPTIVFGHAQGYVLLWPNGRDSILRFERDRDERDSTPTGDDDSEDSLYDILTGRTPIPRLDDMMSNYENDDDDDTGRLEDTFREKKRRGGDMDDSGLDEMF
ncbi:TolB, C-terminal domain-containing protein [Mytilinidion resinicola]|uniref:TolB, C-terminal domain-containing protein n=1 Tax=Mytilinidion resinicola TaxID=574789 RepID=A0A6A6Z554_9PEZI|nr:TolB, C-terminal domain-containing protein [Mytilinidion resinicola]KAF2815793.1 TolB, C-terminal domain-containing protein [Mytilinidion resinicola]